MTDGSIKKVEYEIAGRRLSLLLSVYTAKKLTEKYGSLEDMSEKLENKSAVEQLEDLAFIIVLLADAGRKYAELIGETDLPDTITQEELEVALPMTAETLAELYQKISDTMQVKGDLEIKNENEKN